MAESRPRRRKADNGLARWANPMVILLVFGQVLGFALWLNTMGNTVEAQDKQIARNSETLEGINEKINNGLVERARQEEWQRGTTGRLEAVDKRLDSIDEKMERTIRILTRGQTP